MKDSTIRFIAIVGLLIILGITAFTIGYFKHTQPTLKTTPPFTQDKPLVIPDDHRVEPGTNIPCKG